MKLTLRVWRQKNADADGAMSTYEVPMRIYPAVHYTMGGLWVDYDLQATTPGLIAVGEANRSDDGANRGAAWAVTGADQPPVLHREDLHFEYVHPTQRSYA